MKRVSASNGGDSMSVGDGKGNGIRIAFLSALGPKTGGSNPIIPGGSAGWELTEVP